MDTSGEEKNTTSQEKWWTWPYQGKEEWAGPVGDGSGSKTPGKIRNNMERQLT